jgi:O-antigen ligase
VLWSEVPDESLDRTWTRSGFGSFTLGGRAFDHPHNDYLRILYDFGVVGLGLLLWFALRNARRLRQARSSRVARFRTRGAQRLPCHPDHDDNDNPPPITRS